MAKHHKWTDHERKQLVVLWQQGRTAHDIANALGLTVSQVTSKIIKLRRDGVNLRKGGPVKIDIAGLNALIRALEARNG